MKIQLTKQIFIQDIEEGLETIIPKELSQSRLPYSCRYYDPILAILQSGISDDRKMYFNVAKDVAFNIHRTNDPKQQILEELGVYENEKKEKKLTTIFLSAQKRADIEVNHHKSKHTLNLQRSEYICIDHGTSKEAVLGNNQKGQNKKEVIVSDGAI